MNRDLQLVSASLPLGNLDAYIQRINQIPILSAEEEYELARRLQEDNDLDAAKQLVLAHLRYVARVARGYRGYGLPIGDLIQEGNIGLMKAVKRFDPDVGVRLVSFAVHWIKAEIHEFVIRNWRIVKIATTKAQRKLFFNLRSMKTRLGWFSAQEVNHVAQDLGVSTAEVLRMEERLNAMDTPYDLAETADENSYRTPATYLQDTASNPALLLETWNSDTQNQNHLAAAIQTLDPRSQDILQQRWLAEDKATLHELAAKYTISAERIRQIEKNALKKLKKAIEQNS